MWFYFPFNLLYPIIHQKKNKVYGINRKNRLYEQAYTYIEIYIAFVIRARQ